jgi:hypothetical protein
MIYQAPAQTVPQKVQEPEPQVTPAKPTKIHKLKEVQDDNFTPEYMYPETTKKPSVQTQVQEHTETPATLADTPQSAMTKEACIAMIGQEKFDKYTQMLGGEDAAIKRCVMLRSMQ